MPKEKNEPDLYEAIRLAWGGEKNPTLELLNTATKPEGIVEAFTHPIHDALIEIASQAGKNIGDSLITLGQGEIETAPEPSSKPKKVIIERIQTRAMNATQLAIHWLITELTKKKD